MNYSNIGEILTVAIKFSLLVTGSDLHNESQQCILSGVLLIRDFWHLIQEQL